MTRNLKALGLALLAVFALGAIGAQGASATTDAHEFKSEGRTGILTGKQVGTHEFTVGAAGIVKCTTATFESTSDAGAGKTEVDQITVKPKYEGCTFGGQAATVFFNDCAYVFDSDTSEGNTTIEKSKHADVSIECAEGNVIKIHTVNCTVTVAAQNVPDAVTYAQDTVKNEKGEDVKVASAINVTATAHGIVVGKERNTGAQPANGCLVFPAGAVGKYVGVTTTECRKDEGSAQANPTTPTGTQDAATATCEVTGS